MPRTPRKQQPAAFSSWRKTYATRDDFSADTGPVVRDSLSVQSQALYDAARAKANDLLARLEGRELLVVIGSMADNPKRAYARVFRNAKLLAHGNLTA